MEESCSNSAAIGQNSRISEFSADFGNEIGDFGNEKLYVCYP